MLVGVAPTGDDRGYLFRLQETAGRQTPCVLRFAEMRPRRAMATDLFGENARPVAVRGRVVRFVCAPRELGALRVEF